MVEVINSIKKKKFRFVRVYFYTLFIFFNLMFYLPLLISYIVSCVR